MTAGAKPVAGTEHAIVDDARVALEARCHRQQMPQRDALDKGIEGRLAHRRQNAADGRVERRQHAFMQRRADRESHDSLRDGIDVLQTFGRNVPPIMLEHDAIIVRDDEAAHAALRTQRALQ